MSQTVVPVDFTDPDTAKNKQDLKSQIEFFIGQDAAAKIEINKTAAGYHVVFTADNPDGGSPAVGVV